MGEGSVPSPRPCLAPELALQGQSGSDRMGAADTWLRAAQILSPARPKQLSDTQRPSWKQKQISATIPGPHAGLWVDVKLTATLEQTSDRDL